MGFSGKNTVLEVERYGFFPVCVSLISGVLLGKFLKPFRSVFSLVEWEGRSKYLTCVWLKILVSC